MHEPLWRCPRGPLVCGAVAYLGMYSPNPPFSHVSPLPFLTSLPLRRETGRGGCEGDG